MGNTAGKIRPPAAADEPFTPERARKLIAKWYAMPLDANWA
jgi:hypothetical protein